MTNAEKFKEDFGFWIDEDACITNVNGCGKCPLDKYRDTDKRQDCTQGFWSSDHQGEPTIPLSVIEDIKAEIEELGIWHEKLLIETIDIKRVLEIIDRKVNEVKGDKA